MPIAAKPKAKTAEELKAELKPGDVRFDKPTKVIALATGYSDVIREEGDVFYVPAGTIMGRDCWFRPVGDKTVTTADADEAENMTVAQLKTALAEKGVNFDGITKKADLVQLYVQNVQNGDDLA